MEVKNDFGKTTLIDHQMECDTKKKVTQKRKTKVSDNQEASNINMRHTSKTFFLAVCADPILFGASS